MIPEPPSKRSFLFLQGPISPFFAQVAEGLRALGHQVQRINLHLGDRVFWGATGSVDFTGRADEWPAWIADFLTRHAITDLLLIGEQRPYHRIAIAAAKARGVAVIVTDYGYLRPDWITLERDGMGGNSLFPRDPTEIRRLAEGLSLPDLKPLYSDHFATMALRDVYYHALAQWPFPFRHYQRHQLLHPFLVYAGLARRLLLRRREDRRSAEVFEGLKARGTPFWIFAMQLETDFAIRAYSPFTDMDAPLGQVMASFAAHAPAGTELMIKLHPLDPCWKPWPKRIAAMARAAGIAGRVHIMPRGRLPDLLAASSGMITVNSTAATTAMVLGKPVKLMGQAVYNVPGLSFQPSLDAFWTEGAPPDPDLLEAFLALLCGAFMVRGAFHQDSGLAAAVAGAVARLDQGRINSAPEALLPDA
ncbi:MAG: capsular biosynthesis protein [Alphaproteobacteria bacterium]|nr:capsular biosynthesis protein [Alphaproteobacteria bacterium]